MAKRVPASKMPANASRTTARKAYATALAAERKSGGQKLNEMVGSWKTPKIVKAKKGTTGSLKQIGQRAKVK